MKPARRLKSTTDFNSFRVFEDIYGNEKNSHAYASNYGELEVPHSRSGRGFFIFILFVVAIVIIGFLINP